MMKKVVIYVLCVLILCSCWDRRLLKEHSLILAIGYDLNENGTISKSVSLPKESANKAAQEQMPNESETITTIGHTVSDADIELERYLSQNFDRSKARVLLIGEDLAKHGIFPTLDSMYRDPRGPLGASVAIVSKRAEDGLKIEEKQAFLMSEFYYDLLTTSERSGIIKKENVQSICPLLLSRSRDVVLPHIELDDEGNTANINGLALFTGDKMTGTLTLQHSIMLLILMDEFKEHIKLNIKIDEDHKDKVKNFVTFAIRKSKRKFRVYEESGQIKTDINLKLQVEIDEYPHDELYKKKEVKQLEKKIKKEITKLGKETIKQIQEANSDTLGIGDKVKAHYYDTWKQINWHDIYPEVPITANFDIDIIQHGIIN